MKRIFGLTLASSLFVLLIYQGVNAAVDLVSFTAIVQGNSILVEWETATEIDNAGFYVMRNAEIAPPYEDISGFIPAEGSGVIGAEYQFIDDDVTNGNVYYYWLEAVDTSQNIDLHGPISVTFNTQATQTNTPTATQTPSVTPSRTPSRTPGTTTPTLSRTPTQTRTPSPVNTATPAPPTFTPTFFTETPTHTTTPSITPSPTLLDAPEIIIVFPPTNTTVPTPGTATPLPLLTPTPKGTFTQMIESGSLITLTAICLVFLVWVVIAVGLFIYIQKRNT